MQPALHRTRFIAALTVAALGLAQTACAGGPAALPPMPFSPSSPPSPPSPPASEGFSAGIDIRTETNASDIGLPIYPGAMAQRDSVGDKPSISLGLWGGALGFKLVAMKFASNDSIDDVASFYRRALSHYGTVLDCNRADAPRGSDQIVLTCGNDKPQPGSRVFKVGIPRLQHTVSLQQVGKAVHFQLVRIETKSDGWH